MRKLMWAACGFSGAIFCVTRWMWSGCGYLLAALGCLFLLTAGVGIWFSRLRIPAVLLLGAFVGCAWLLVLQKCYYEPLFQLDDRTVSGELLLTGYPEESDYGLQASASFNWAGRQYPARLFLGSEDRAEPGNLLEGTFRIRLTIPGGSKESNALSGSRILALVTPKGDYGISTGRAGALRFFPARLARGVEEILRSSIPEDVASFARALLLGGSGGLDYAAKTALSVSGIRHIVAVSGLHVGILCGALWLLTGKNRRVLPLVGIPALFLFAAMAGFPPSVCRAGLMAGLLMLAPLLGREYDGLTALAAAVLVLLLWNPLAVQGAGFQLSVLSVMGILLFYPRLSESWQDRRGNPPKKGPRNRLLHFVMDSLCLTLSAMSLSTPAAVCYFGLFSLLAPITNLLCLGLVMVAFYGVCLTCIAGAVFLPAGKILGSLTAVPLGLVLNIAGGISRFPLAALYTASPVTVPFLIVLYGLVLVRLLTRRGKWRFYALGAGAALTICVLLSSLGWRMEECRLTVLDVGQGQSLLLQSKGQTVVVDCGGWSEEGAADMAAERLLSQGIRSVSALALTHYDRDHCGGVQNLLTRVNAEALLLPGGEGEAMPGDLEIPIQRVTAPVSIPVGVGELRLFPYSGTDSAQENSMAILFETENCAILITGDWDEAGEWTLLQQAAIPRIDVLVVGHHGSKNATSQELLDKTRPRVAVISVGAGNRYGHPTQQTLERLKNAGCRIYRTDQQGTIIIRR